MQHTPPRSKEKPPRSEKERERWVKRKRRQAAALISSVFSAPVEELICTEPTTHLLVFLSGIAKSLTWVRPLLIASHDLSRQSVTYSLKEDISQIFSKFGKVHAYRVHERRPLLEIDYSSPLEAGTSTVIHCISHCYLIPASAAAKTSLDLQYSPELARTLFIEYARFPFVSSDACDAFSSRKVPGMKVRIIYIQPDFREYSVIFFPCVGRSCQCLEKRSWLVFDSGRAIRRGRRVRSESS